MEIEYSCSKRPTAIEVINLYNQAGLARPTNDEARIAKMLENSNLIVTAWHDERLIGICRCITDWAWCCYLSDLAVDPDFKKTGIGKELVRVTKDKIGEECMLLLLSVPTAFEYYPKIGFEKENRAFMLPRNK